MEEKLKELQKDLDFMKQVVLQVTAAYEAKAKIMLNRR